MRLYLIQHGEATSKDVDPDRPLTEKGREDSAKTAGFLRSAGTSVDVIWHSAKTRAIETAAIFFRELSPEEGPVQREGLAPMDLTRDILKEVEAQTKDIMLVGHLPFMAKLASLALVGEECPEVVKFQPGGVVCLEQSENKDWQVAFEIVPDIL